ncbi:MAG: GTP 3',8-cyclase MoaA [Anaerolineae bacterium]|nr:GTP 3',8-cyclase MoaA [Anaerolineae bacterium]MBK7203676.1 GTP 3',8-cyclase MoaA [Anaerolineae bacterium]MBK9095340.1 GTP 3',8-cyclase MoaA [Anaerolineae bacterium]MBK9232247.1 GTP 3',8-cyclase MoaA [Anaerolineae bacterium]
MHDGLHDAFGRRIDYLRISLTDVCNLRCVYCMPEEMQFQPRAELLQDDEVIFIVQAAARLGVRKVRLTGGEPTVRRHIVELVRRVKQVPGIQEVAMTTNGVLLTELAFPLAAAGLDRVNISVDTLDAASFQRITRWGSLHDVWSGVEAAEAAGLKPIKLNCVVTRGYNDQEVADLARLTFAHAWEVRFIELMPFGEVANFAHNAVVPYQETMAQIEQALGPLIAVPGYDGHDPSRPYRLAGAQGTLGFISSVTQPFCAGCGRVRVTADGKLRLCLLRDNEVDLLTPLRQGCSLDELQALLRVAVWGKPWGHGLAHDVVPALRVMSQIGG